MRVVTDEDGLGGMDSPLFPLDPDLDARLVPRTPSAHALSVSRACIIGDDILAV